MLAFLITFRETLEAALIVWLLLSIVNVFYKKFDKWHVYILWGTIVGIILSLLFAYGFYVIFGWFEWKVEKIYEGVLMFVAFLMISHLLIWTNKNANKFSEEISWKVKRALVKSELWILFVITCLSVSREGVETVIFMNALDLSTGPANFVYGILWIISALTLSAIMFFSIKRLDISKIFKLTNILLLFIAAGLLAHSIVEFQWAWLIPTFIKPIFDLSWILSENEWLWSFLKAMFWYDANPSLIAVVAYFSFLIWFFYYNRAIKKL
jgi:high-affinity iron transporter